VIENFMIAANRTTAHFLDQAGSPAIQRVVRTPEKLAGDCGTRRRWQEFFQGADPKALSQFLLRRKAADPERLWIYRSRS